MPEDVCVRLIDSTASLAAVQQDLLTGGALSDVDAVGIDAEWASGTATPAAALLQLALRSSRTGSCTALVLDLMMLPHAEVVQLVQRLFADAATLKLGFGLAGDLWAVSQRLGLSAVRSVRPAVDVRPLQQLLAKHGTLQQAPLPGLSGLADLHLGAPLDKALQCCEWEARPLSEAQLRYAAADAVCLLHIVDAMAAAAPPAQHALRPDSTAQPAELRRPNGRSAADAAQPAAGGSSADAHPAPTLQHANGSSSALETAQVASGSRRFDAELVSRHWGEAWTLKRLDDGRMLVDGQVAGRLLNAMSAPGRKGSPPAFADRPVRLPWSQPEDARFVCDVMAEGLARQLRLCGIDAASAPVDPHTQPRHRMYRALVDCAEAEGRVVLTADRAFIERRYCDAAYFIRGNDKRSQLQEVLVAFSIDTDALGLLSRCAKCNGEFEDRPLSGDELPEDSKVPAAVRKSYTKFWRCGSCEHIYWHGGQYDNAVLRLTKELQRFAVR